MTDHHALLNAFRLRLLATGSELVAQFLASVAEQPEKRPLSAQTVPVAGRLHEIAGQAAAADRPLVEALLAASDDLHWNRTYTADEFGPHFYESYGWVELFGTRGHFVSDIIAGGFLLLGPGVVYPDHSHIAEEIYLPLTDGSLWSKGGSAFALQPTGTVIHHPSAIDHAMTTTDRPLLAAYLWRGGPLAQKPTIKKQETT